VRALIGLGSNLGDGPEMIRAALRELEKHDGIQVERVSSLYRTAPWGNEAQTDFTNAVAELSTSLAPAALLRQLLRTERLLGRVRDGVRWGPRHIDLDLLCCEGLELHSAELELPHPRMHLRAFVLVPLLELDPNAFIPGVGYARDCLEQVGAQGVQRLG